MQPGLFSTQSPGSQTWTSLPKGQVIPRARRTLAFENVDLTIFRFLKYVFKKNFWIFYNALCYFLIL